MFSMKSFSCSPLEVIRCYMRNSELIYDLVRQEVVGRYKGSFLGIFWSLLTPMLMLGVYTFVFSVVFNAKWSASSASKTEFALVLFSGLLVFNVFSECVNRAPLLIVGNPNYVKKVVFPLEILTFVSIGTAIFHMALNLTVWLIFYGVFFGIPNVTIILLPIVMLPLVFITLGLSWLLAALGVYLRDLVQLSGLLTSTLLFISPVFFPISALPIEYQSLLEINPLTGTIEQVRDVLIWGKIPDAYNIVLSLVISIFVAWIGFTFFQKTRAGFADVV